MKHIFFAVCFFCLSITLAQAQESQNNSGKNKGQESLKIKVKDAAHPDVYINGKKYDMDILGLLDPKKIESMEVLKNEEAAKYNAPNGVILIKTVKDTGKTQSGASSIKIKGTGSLNNYKSSGSPKIYIDGEVSSKKELEKLSSHDISDMEVIKGKEAQEEYDAEHGVILITTKEHKKQQKKKK
jgi:hypothetical protein